MAKSIEEPASVQLSNLLGNEERAARFSSMFDRILNTYLADPASADEIARPSTVKNLERQAGITNPIALINFFCQVTNAASLKVVAEASEGFSLTTIQQQLIVVIMLAHIQARGTQEGDSVTGVLQTLKLSLERGKRLFVDTRTKDNRFQMALYLYLITYVERLEVDQDLLSKFTQLVTSQKAELAKAEAV